MLTWSPCWSSEFNNPRHIVLPQWSAGILRSRWSTWGRAREMNIPISGRPNSERTNDRRPAKSRFAVHKRYCWISVTHSRAFPALAVSNWPCGINRNDNDHLSLLRNTERRLDSNLMSVLFHTKVFAACSTHVALIVLSPKFDIWLAGCILLSPSICYWILMIKPEQGNFALLCSTTALAAPARRRHCSLAHLSLTRSLRLPPPSSN